MHLANVAGSQRPLTFCSCAAGRRSGCHHLKALSQSIREFYEWSEGRPWSEIFVESRWYQLAHVLFDGQTIAAADVEVVQGEARGADSDPGGRWF